MNIRASMLDGWNDCSRRAAAKQYRREIEAMGYELRTIPPSVGAAVGTAVHVAVADMLRAKLEGREPEGVPRVLDSAMESFLTETDSGVEWDDTTKNRDDARRQIEALARGYLPRLQEARPIAVEESLRAHIEPGWELTGTLDLWEEGGRIDDLKTGVVRRPYIAQLGAYGLLKTAHGEQVNSAGTTWLKRVRPDKDQPEPERTPVEVRTAMTTAHHTIRRIMDAMREFLDNQRPEWFPANPMSMMCTPKYCPAWGTKFCRVHLPSKES